MNFVNSFIFKRYYSQQLMFCIVLLLNISSHSMFDYVILVLQRVM